MLQTLFETFKENHYSIIRFDRYWRDRESYDKKHKIVLLRHDVDRFPRTALDIARMEANMGVYGTFLFRAKPWTYKPNIIREISSLGHEIGYHYETLVDSGGDYGEAKRLFAQNLDGLRTIAPVVSASMHSRPLSSWDNRLLWEKYSLQEFGLLGETYRSVDHYKYVYLADSGRNWGGNRNVIWDYVQGQEVPSISGTSELCDLITNGSFDSAQLLIHPERWRKSFPGWMCSRVLDFGTNRAKDLTRLL
ncbi:hypothetical protein MJD09_14720 [bacterium]|nr:hypothetical protein [bacterium]